MNKDKAFFVHPTAIVEPGAIIGEGSNIWAYAQVREFAHIGKECNISKDVFVDYGVTVGDRCKIQNSVSLFHGCVIEDDVFIGPMAAFTNDLLPRAFVDKWKLTTTLIKKGASIGANATIICGVTIGEYAMVAAGSVVTKDVEPFSMVMGAPAKHHYWVNKRGERVEKRPALK